MHRISTPLFLLALANLCISATLGQDINSRLISTQMLHAQGLEREWETHAQVDPSYGRLATGVVHVNSKKSLTQYLITYGNQREIIQETDIGPNGQPYGVVGAQEAANLRIEILAAEGIVAEVAEEVLPFITLYILTDQFVVQAIDAETGATKWATQIGQRRWPTSSLAVSDNYVCLTNGMTLHCLDAETGKPLWERRMDRTAGGGPLITDNYVYVPKVNGTVEIISLTDPKKPSEQLLSFGRAMNSPIETKMGNAVWVSDRSTMFVASTGEGIGSISYRIGFNRPISGNVAAGDNDTLIVGTDDGAIHCLSEARGGLLWKQFIANPLRQDPLVSGDDVYLVSLGPILTVLSLETGLEKWATENISKVLSISGDRVFAMDKIGRILVLDRNTGRRISVIDSIGLSFAVTNPISDRIYVGTRSGIIQCIRGVDKHKAQLNVALDLKPNLPGEEPTDVGPKPVRPVAPKPTEPADEDPFGVKKDDDPFGID